MQAKPVGAFSALNRTSKNGVGTVDIFSPAGRESVPVQVNSSFEDTDELMLVERITDAIVDFAKLNKMFFKTTVEGLKFNLITPHAGGNSIGSIFSAGLVKIKGEKRLLLSIARDNDPGTDTVCFSWITCQKNKESTQEFKNTVKECVSELIHDGAYVLRERANLRKSFNF